MARRAGCAKVGATPAGYSTTPGPTLLPKTRVKPLLLLAAFCLLWCFAWPASPARAEETSRPFGTVVKEWNRVLSQIEQELARRVITAPRAEVLRGRLTEIRQEALEVERLALARMKPLQARLDPLGPPPSA